jgi:hypothetical protein
VNRNFWKRIFQEGEDHFNPAFPDSDVTSVRAGLEFFCRGKGQFLWLYQCGGYRDGLLWRKAIGIALAYMGIFFDFCTVTGSPNPVINETYKTTTHSGFVTFRVNF